MLTGAEYFKLNALGQTKSPSSIVLKNRRGGYVIGYRSNSEAKKAYDAIKKALQDNRIIELNYSSEPHKLRGGAPDNSYMFRTADGRYIDPEIGDISPEAFNAAWPKINPSLKNIGVPLVFGTAGSVDQPHWAHEIYKNGGFFTDDVNPPVFISADSYHEEAGPFPELNDKEYFELARAKSRRLFGSEIFAAESIRRSVFPDGTLPKDFFEYDPNGRNK